MYGSQADRGRPKQRIFGSSTELGKCTLQIGISFRQQLDGVHPSFRHRGVDRLSASFPFGPSSSFVGVDNRKISWLADDHEIGFYIFRAGLRSNLVCLFVLQAGETDPDMPLRKIDGGERP